jgi:formate dehydrogenase subunit gamma
MTDQTHEHEILRYRRNQRLVHALLASSFLLLLLTGLLLLWGPLSFLAAGGNSRWLHRVGAVGFMAVPFAYLTTDRAGAKELLVESFKYDRDDVEWLKHLVRYVFGRASEMPPQGRLNAGQKLHHAAVIVISATIVISGLAMWFIKPTLGEAGLAWTAVVHDLSMLALTLLLVGHLYFTYVYKAISSMTTGYVDEDDARLEHPKWVAELERQQAAQESVAEQETADAANKI